METVKQMYLKEGPKSFFVGVRPRVGRVSNLLAYMYARVSVAGGGGGGGGAPTAGESLGTSRAPGWEALPACHMLCALQALPLPQPWSLAFCRLPSSSCAGANQTPGCALLGTLAHRLRDAQGLRRLSRGTQAPPKAAWQLISAPVCEILHVLTAPTDTCACVLLLPPPPREWCQWHGSQRVFGIVLVIGENRLHACVCGWDEEEECGRAWCSNYQSVVACARERKAFCFTDQRVLWFVLRIELLLKGGHLLHVDCAA